MKITAASLFLIAATLVGCEDPKRDMGDQLRYDPHQSTPFFANGLSTRQQVPGTVARDDGAGTGISYLKGQTNLGGQEFTAAKGGIPFAIDRGVLERGQEQFLIYCSACHGRLGNGAGMIVQRGLTAPPSFHIDRLKNANDAHFYNVITHGYGVMLSYDDRIAEQDRWQIVSYIRALQAAGENPGLSEADRAALTAGGDRATQTNRTTEPGQKVEPRGGGH